MFARPSIAQASLGLSLMFALIQPALSQISANGAGTIATPQGNQVNISGGIQAGGNLFHSFQDFNVNAEQVANFLSNPQTQNIFGRINGGNPSVINGLLQVTGGNSNLFLMNPAGIIFGQGASLNLPASFTATTANQIGFGNSQYFSAVGENNFSALTGSPNSFLFTTNESGSIVNAGNLAVTSGQSISLIGGNIVNTGNLDGGNITLAAVPGTNRVRISQPGHLLSLEITPSADSTIAPLDLPRLLTGQNLPGISSNGETVEVNGMGIPAGQGVNVTSGNLGTFSEAGTINIWGDRVVLLGANLNASGVEGGGTIRVGGEYRGGGNNPFNSRITYVDAGSFLNADALNAGDGGRVIVWGDDVTRFYGNIAARGGANGGNGGFAEVSGAQTLTFAGNADLSAPRGSFGTLLLDPVNILISNGAEDLGTCVLAAFIPTCGPDDITISQTNLETLSAAADIILEASNNITFGTLTGGSLNFATCTAGTCGDITFTAGGAFDTSGNNINAFGRNLTIEAASITAGNIDTSISTVSRNGGDINLTATGGDIRARWISSGSSTNGGNAGNGGNITISSTVTVDITGVIIPEISPDPIALDSRSVVAGIGDSGDAGTIDINARSINIGGIIAAYSRVDDGVSGNGNDVNITATNGGVRASGITTGAGASFTGTGNSGNAGNITINAAGAVDITGVIVPAISPTDIISLDTRSASFGGGNAGTGGDITVTSGGIFTTGGAINSFSAAQRGIGDSGDAGRIAINAESIVSGAIIASSLADRGNSGNGGNTQLTANNGGLTTPAVLTFTAVLTSGNSGNGGNITINATDNINLSGLVVPIIEPLLLLPLGLYSRSFVRSMGNAGNGGNIKINQSFTNNGVFSATGEINSSSGVTNNIFDAIGTSGSGGVIAINAQRINTDNIDSSSRSVRGNSVNGGSINISSQGNLSTGSIDSFSFSSSFGGTSGNGGSINISSQGDLSTRGIRADSRGGNGGLTSGNGGLINISSQGNLSTGYISALSASGNNTENGGSINLSSQGNLSTGYILSYTSGNNTSGSGGLISISSQGNLSIFGNIISSATGLTTGNGGSISISSQGNLSTFGFGINSFSLGLTSSGNGGSIDISSQGNLSTGLILSGAMVNGGSGGNITINAGNLFLASESFISNDGTLVSITSQGGGGGGAITITHGGSTSVPFLVGGATVNGTVGAITSGTGINTINNLTVPVPPAINNYGTNISIRTTAPDPISPILIPLLTNPEPPPTPNPVIVGTPPILAVDPIPATPIINIPENTPSTEQITIVPPTINNPVAPPIINNPPIVIPPPPPTNPQLSRPILEANSPGVQSPVSLAAANSSIPIIDRIPVNSQNNKIRLLDDPFKEEFQAYSGISDEIATLDVNQAQDILQRIIRETNTKPVFIYVFFAPENEVERTVNSARGLSSPLRVAQDTDILEVVLVPPTGDLVRVKYPGLKRPQVIETAQRFVSLTINQRNGYIGSARQFHEWIIAPLQEELKKREINNLVFLMDVGLRSIPLAAMRDKNNSDRFIIEDYSVGLMPSLTLTDTSYTSLRGSEVLGMGSANFVEKSPLPAVPLELNAINQLWGGSTLFNENFTLNNLRQARRPGQRIVHLATHGVFASGEKSNSYIQLWGNERLTLDQIRQAGWGDPPIDLLVLSACETALGDRESELGFAGLAVQAGVKSALASLWLVSDEGTLGLMTEFYKQLQETTTKSEALRLAQLAMLRGEVRLEGGNLVTPQGTFPLNEELRRLGNGDRSFQHPYFWSGFTMVGNPW
jgi:filamentous hemagglutinin family protein